MTEISVVIVCYQEGELLRRAFASLEAQSEQNFEIVVVNDASRDAATNGICRELEQQKKVQVVWHSKNLGLSGARNSGYEKMTGNICVPLDADDILPPGAIAKIREGFRQFPEADFVFGNYIMRNVEKGTEELVDCSHLCSSNGVLDPRQLGGELGEKWTLLGTSPCRKSTWQEIGGYSEAFSNDLQDVDLFMRLLSQDGKGYYLGHTIYEWNRSAMGMNSEVPPEVLNRVQIANIPFYDMFGNGIQIRKNILRSSVHLGDFVSVQRIARQLLRLRYISSSIIVAAIFPPNLTRLVYRVARGVRNLNTTRLVS